MNIEIKKKIPEANLNKNISSNTKTAVPINKQGNNNNSNIVNNNNNNNNINNAKNKKINSDVISDFMENSNEIKKLSNTASFITNYKYTVDKIKNKVLDNLKSNLISSNDAQVEFDTIISAINTFKEVIYFLIMSL